MESMFRRSRLAGIFSASLATVLLGIAGTNAANTTLNAVLYPDNEKVDVKFETTDRVPKATLAGNVRSEQGQSQIEVSWKKLEPALLFGGDANCWVLWTLTPDGTAQGLGELPVRADGNGSARFSAPFKQFALMVTAEPFPVVKRPSDLVAFVSLPSTHKLAKNTAFDFAGFRPSTKRDVETLEGLEYTDKTPVELQQARKAIELMDRYEAEKHAQAAARDARVSLGQAEDAYSGRVGKSKDVPELARRTVALASEAVRGAIKQVEELKSQEAEAQRLAELAQKQAESEAERAARLKTEADLAAVQAQKDQIQRERDALAKRLSGALGKVSATERTARGLVVSLSGGILFGTGRSDLTPEAKIALAKLSGILLMIQTKNIQIEGHTDTTGSEETNARLSLERASAVKDFMRSQGVDEARMVAKGLGSTQPVASNDTTDGRAKNRRVEIVVPE